MAQLDAALPSRLLGSDGRPINSTTSAKGKAFKKGSPPRLGEQFGDPYANSGILTYRFNSGGIVQFNLNALTLEDYRVMTDHYQIRASLAVLTFMIHQLDWRINSDNAKVAKFCQENIEEVWTRLIRAISAAFWAGYSPCILQWENDLDGRAVRLGKIKDLEPTNCEVNWLDVEGYAPPGHKKPKLKVYDGIKVRGLNWPIPKENTFWYPLLMEQGNYYGKKLLRSAFTPWYFSMLVHMFANRYFERFGEPIPVGRAPYGEEIDVDGNKVTGMQLMSTLMSQLRNRSVVVLPNDKTPASVTDSDPDYDYQLEYLESQMRGADFERYLMRLDEEMSLSLFTPLLIIRTADVGSYNLGTGHWNLYQQMLNALSGDLAEYINRYILAPLVNFNFGPKAARAKIVFRRLGDDRQQLAITLLQALISGGKAMPDLQELGQIAGLSVAEVKELIDKPDKPDGDTNDDSLDDQSDDQSDDQEDGDGGKKNNRSGKNSDTGRSPKGSSNSTSIITGQFANLNVVRSNIVRRVQSQISKAERTGDAFSPSLGYRRQLESVLKSPDRERLDRMYSVLEGWLTESYTAGVDKLDIRFNAMLITSLAEFSD